MEKSREGGEGEEREGCDSDAQLEQGRRLAKAGPSRRPCVQLINLNKNVGRINPTNRFT